jgi:YidC/Oxa1 family membrane protein insertase
MEQRNLVLAFALSLIVLLGWNVLFPPAQPQSPPPQPAAAAKPSNVAPAGQAAAPPVATALPPSVAIAPEPPAASPATTGTGKSFELANDVIRLQINEKGWFTNVRLKAYKESLDPDAAEVAVVNVGDEHSVYINSGVIGARQDTPFSLVKQTAASLILRSRLNGGQSWQKEISLKQGSYIVDVKDTIINGAGMRLYRQAVERNPDKKLNTRYEHLGPTGLLNGKLVEPDYDDLDEKGAQRQASRGGWTAIMSRYFIAAIVTSPEKNYSFYFKGEGGAYQAGLIDDGVVQGKDAFFHTSLFLGPKALSVLETAQAELERSVNYGWFAPIAKPMHSYLGWLYGYLGNYGFCIIVLVLCLKVLFFYPTQKSYESMAAMRKLQPEMNRLKELYGDDKQKMGQEVMQLYKRHKVNPMGGCVPMVIQIPVFFALYKVLLMSIELRHAPFIGWITDMSVQDPYYVLPLLMGASMLVQQRLNPQPADKMQAKVMQFLPLIFTAMFLFFPAGLVLYWVVNNILSIIQQRLVMKSMNVD